MPKPSLEVILEELSRDPTEVESKPYFEKPEIKPKPRSKKGLWLAATGTITAAVFSFFLYNNVILPGHREPQKKEQKKVETTHQYNHTIQGNDIIPIKPFVTNTLSSCGKEEDNQNIEEKIIKYRAVLRDNPKNINRYYDLGNALHDYKDYRGAIVVWEKALKIKNNDAGIHNNLGIALNQTGDIEGAIKEYEEAIRVDPDDIYPHYNLGNLLKSRGDIKGAIKEWEKISINNPNEIDMYNKLGKSMFKQGYIEKATRIFKATLKLDDGQCITHYNLGNVLYKEGDVDGAMDEWNNALILNPDFDEARHNLELIKRKK